MDNKNYYIIDKLSRLAFITAIIGVCIIGICPAFGVIGIVVPSVLKSKKVEMSSETGLRNKRSVIAGIISLIMFVIDLVLIIILNGKFNWF